MRKRSTQARSQDCMEGGSTRGPGVEGAGTAPAGCGGRAPAFRKFSIFLLKIDHSETSEFMILGSLHR